MPRGRLLVDARFLVGCDDHVENATDVFQPGSGNDNGIAPAVGILGDAQETTARILTEIKDKILSLDRDVFTF